MADTHLSASDVATFVNRFKYSTSISSGANVAESTSTTGEKSGYDVKRQFLAHYVLTESKTTGSGDSAVTTDTYELLGYKVADASVEFNWDSDPVTDITGATYRTIKKSEPQMTLDGYIINTKSTFLDKLAKKAIRNAYTEFNNETIVTVYYWLSANKTDGTETKEVYLAKQETNCSIVPTSIGGEGTLGITPEITFSNKAYFGYVPNSISETSPSAIEFHEATSVDDVTERT